MSTPESRRHTLPRFTVFGGLALAAASASCLTGVAATAHAAPNTAPAPTNGPIAYTTSLNGIVSVVHTVNPDGTGDAELPISDPGAYNGLGAGSQPGFSHGSLANVTYSPDGTHMVFSGDNCSYVADADGTGAMALNTVPQPLVPCTDYPIGHGMPTIANPTIPVTSQPIWSADSKSIYFADSATGKITILSVDGTTQTTHPFTVPPGSFLQTVLSNGALVISVGSTIAIVDPGSTNPRNLTTGSEARFSAASGKLLVKGTVATPGSSVSSWTLFVVDPVTATRAQITDPSTENVQTAAWSPDGQDVAYSLMEPGNASSVYSRPAASGTTRTPVVHSTGIVMVSSWHNGPITPARAADRLAGADRIDTAVHVSQWSYDKHGAGGRQANVAVLSRSDQFADALGGSALAAQKGGPLLLTPTAALDDRAKAELTRVLGPGATVYVLGGTSALSPAVEQSIRDLGFVPQRLQGPDRFSTATTIAAAVSAHPHTVMVATGRNFPDALAAGAAAAQDPNGGVVILSDDAALPAPVKTYLSGIDPTTTNVYAVGGQGKAALAAGFPSWRPTPLAGNDRYETAELVAKSPLFSGPIGSVGLATGSAWPDALSGGALIATQHGPLLLTPPAGAGDQLPQVERDLVVALAPHLSNVVVFGGPNAVVSGLEMNTATVAFGANHFFTYVNRVSPTVAGPR